MANTGCNTSKESKRSKDSSLQKKHLNSANPDWIAKNIKAVTPFQGKKDQRAGGGNSSMDFASVLL
jgi:hypothetical protein